jgi:hypothetical protein
VDLRWEADRQAHHARAQRQRSRLHKVADSTRHQPVPESIADVAELGTAKLRNRLGQAVALRRRRESNGSCDIGFILHVARSSGTRNFDQINDKHSPPVNKTVMAT